MIPDPYFSIASARLIEAEQAYLSADTTARDTVAAEEALPVSPETRRLARALRNSVVTRPFIN